MAAVRPCLRALKRTAALASGVFGPWDFLALARLAASWRALIRFFGGAAAPVIFWVFIGRFLARLELGGWKASLLHSN